MAGADGLRNLELEPLDVPQNLFKRGNKFIKWPKCDGDDTIVATPVTLRIDPKGYIIYWQEPNKDTESLEVSCIRDTRIEKYARIPKPDKWEKALQCADPQIRDIAGNTSIPLESKCLTIVHGMKFHEPNFLNFIAVEENPLDIIKQWADFLLDLACHPLTWHISVEKSIEKMHTKLRYETNQFGRIPVKKCIKMFGGNPKRAESALHSVGLMTKGKKDETIDPGEFPLIAFKKVLQLTCQRPELDKVFTQLGARRMSLSLQQMKKFVNTDQRDPRLNEILHPFLTDDQVMDIIQKYEPNIMLANRSQLSLEGLDAYLQSDENLPVSSAQYGLYQDMNQPLSHYFINSSHNTYLTGNQYRSRSNAEIYRQCLLSGCRCIELDCWESTTGDEPIITHGFTLCSEVLVKEVIEAINESAFKTSQYPVILSFENHVDNPTQQAKMAQYCRDIFGDKLLIDPLESHELNPGTPLPSPRELMGKIIVKNKKQKPTHDTIKRPSEEKGVLQPSRSLDYSDLGSRHKHGSIQYETSVSPSSVSNSVSSSPNIFTPGRPAHQSAAKRKQSAPAVSISSRSTPLAMSPSLPITHSGNTLLNNFGSTNGSVESRNGNSKSKARKGNIKKMESFEEESSELEKVDLACASATLPRGTPAPLHERRKVSAPTPTTERAKSFEQNGSIPQSVEEAKDSNGENGADESTSEDAESKEKDDDEDYDDEDDEEGGRLEKDEFDENMGESGTATKESRAYEAMSSLVNYMQPVRFKSFEISDRRDRCYEMSSFTENAALRLITYYPTEIVNYNKRQLSRIYPKGARVDSSNYNPQLFWNAGCQLVALNFQTLGPNMQLNLALFEFNKNCGYLLKPEHMRRKDRQFDPFTHNTLDAVVPASVAIKVISGQFLSSSRVSTFVEVDLLGLVADTVKRKFKTNTIYNNGTNPHFDSDTFTFKKIVLPAIATLRIGVMDTNGNCLGQRFLPIEGLRPGYRYITLRNEGNQPLTMPSLFLHIDAKDYIPEKLELIAWTLANPIEHLKKQEKEMQEIKERRVALKRLLDEDELDKLADHLRGPCSSNGKDHVSEAKHAPEQNNVGRDSVDGGEGLINLTRGPETKEAKVASPVAEKPKKPPVVEQQLKTFKPAVLEEIKACREFHELRRKSDKKVTKFIKRQREQYDLVYGVYFDNAQRSTFSGFNWKRRLEKVKGLKLPFDVNPALHHEAKKEHMLKLLRKHLGEEKDKKQKLNDDFIRSFEDLVRVKQEAELKKLEKVSASEKSDVYARKRAEKDEKLRDLPKYGDKTEHEQKKKEIVQNHIRECVQELKKLSTLQDERLETVKNQQQEILLTITDEERMRVDKITHEYNEQLQDIEKIYDIRQADHTRGHGTNINSVTYSNTEDVSANDGEYVTKL